MLASRVFTRRLHDVVIVGAGPAGLTLAASLKANPVTSSLKIAVLEGSSLDPVREWGDKDDIEGYSNRVSSLTPKSVEVLKSIGVWNNMKTDRVQPYEEMKVWDGVSNARIDFDSLSLAAETDGEVPIIATMCENLNLQSGLLKTLATSSGVDILDKSRVSSITRLNPTETGSFPTVTLESGDKLEARLLVGADGANSPVRKFAGIESRGWDYNTFGLVASLKLEWEDYRNIAFQRFLPTGPIAMLPLPDGYASLVWSTRPHIAKHLLSLSPENFVAAVNAAFRLEPADLKYMYSINDGLQEELDWRLDVLSESGSELVDANLPVMVDKVLDKSRAAFPLKMKHADTYVGDRIALVGDAAHTTHPLAGQGLNMGQRDVEFLTEALVKGMSRGLDIGSELCLEPYWANAYLPNHLKLGVVDKLHKLYSTDNAITVAVRSFGLDAVNKLGFVKDLIMQQAAK